MQLQRTTWVLMGLAILLGASVLVLELRQDPEPGAIAASDTDSSGSDLFAFEEQDIQALTMDSAAQTLAFERDAERNWRMTQPESSLANQSAVAYVLNLMVTSQATSPTEITPNQKQDFGLEVPYATLEVTLQNGQTHRLVLGDTNFDGASRYAIVTSDAEAASKSESEPLTVVLVPNTFVSAIDRPLQDWQQVELPSPEPTPETSDDTSDSTESEAEAVNGGEPDASEEPVPTDSPSPEDEPSEPDASD